MTLDPCQGNHDAAQDDAIFRRAIAFHKSGQVDQALELYRSLVPRNANRYELWLNLAALLSQQGRWSAASAAARRAIELRPEDFTLRTNHGHILIQLNRLEESLREYAAALQFASNNVAVLREYGTALNIAGRLDEAVSAFDQALHIKEDDASAKWLRGLTLLSMGQMRQGLQDKEARWRCEGVKMPAYPGERWQGETFVGKTLLLFEDQGHGDSILCSRYIPMVKARGGRVVLLCRKALHRLFKELPLDGICDASESIEHIDYHCPLTSVMSIFETTLESIPTPSPLHCSPSVPEHAQQLVRSGSMRFRVGIVWAGSETSRETRRRAVNVERFLELAEIPNVQLYSLQKGPREKELSNCGADSIVFELGSFLSDFADTAAIVKQLDLIIMTDSAVAHLAGSLGHPIWNLLSFQPYWLWLRKRDDSPWYPAMRLFRQPSSGDWDSVFKSVAEELKKAVDMKMAGTWPPQERV